MTTSTVDPILVELREARVSRGITVQQLTLLLGNKSPSYLSLAENGRTSPTVRYLRRWAAALDLAPTLTPLPPTNAKDRTNDETSANPDHH